MKYEALGLGHIHRYDLRDFKGRVFFVSDIHGHFDLLHKALRDLAFNSQTDLLFVGGDNCDRGPDSKYVLDYITEPWYISIRGNHDQMFVDGFDSHWHPNNWSVKCLKAHGGEWIWGLTDLEKILIADVFRNLPLGIELLLPHGRKVGIVHAECPYMDWDAFVNTSTHELEWNDTAIAQWSRTWYDRSYKGQVKGVDFVLAGHTPTDSGEVELLGNMVFTDAGSFFRNKLNVIELDDIFMRKIK